MERFGRNPDTFLKDGILQDVVMLGISPGEQ
jgi:hypothetical protein